MQFPARLLNGLTTELSNCLLLRNSEVHSALSSRAGLSPFRLLSGTVVQRVLVLVNVFVGRNYMRETESVNGGFLCAVRSETFVRIARWFTFGRSPSDRIRYQRRDIANHRAARLEDFHASMRVRDADVPHGDKSEKATGYRESPRRAAGGFSCFDSRSRR